MLNPVIFLGVAIVIVVVVLFILSYINKKRSPTPEEVEQRPRGAPILRGEGADAPRRAHRNVRARMRAAAAARQEEEDEDEDEEEVDLLADDIVMPDGKVGTKKRKKLEMKAEKRRERERELEEREERKQRQLELDEKRRKEALLEKELEHKQEEAERVLKEEQEKRELEEYLKLKEAFAVEEEGFDEEEIDQEGHKFQEFIDYIKTEKVVLLEDLASHFKLKTQDCIDRVQDLLTQEWLTGVIDDRGKFVYITIEELESVAQFIRQRGRVSISELVDCSNTLINLTPEVSPVAT